MASEVAVIDTVNLFHLCVDRRAWVTARSCLAGVVRVSLDGQDTGQEMPGDQFLGMIRSNVESFSTTQHLVAGHHVHFEDEAAARCQASCQHYHVSDAGRWVLAGQQDVRLRRARDAWKITEIRLLPAWEEGKHPAANR